MIQIENTFFSEHRISYLKCEDDTRLSIHLEDKTTLVVTFKNAQAKLKALDQLIQTLEEAHRSGASAIKIEDSTQILYDLVKETAREYSRIPERTKDAVNNMNAQPITPAGQYVSESDPIDVLGLSNRTYLRLRRLFSIKYRKEHVSVSDLRALDLDRIVKEKIHIGETTAEEIRKAVFEKTGKPL